MFFFQKLLRKKKQKFVNYYYFFLVTTLNEVDSNCSHFDSTQYRFINELQPERDN